MQITAKRIELMSPSSSAEFQRVESKAAIEIWHLIRPYVQRLLNVSDGEYSERDVFDYVWDGRFQLWLAWSQNRIEGFAISHIVEYPRKRTLQITGAGGTDAKKYLPEAMKQMKAFALEMGCQSPIEIRGRRGWSKFLPEYEVEQMIFRVPL